MAKQKQENPLAFDIDRPDLDWVAMATGIGVAAGRATSCEELTVQLQRGLAEPRPYLIEAVT